MESVAGNLRLQAAVVVMTLAVVAAPAQGQQLAVGADVPEVNVLVVDGNDRNKDSRGTGFLIARDTWVTAAHVVNGCAAVYVKIANEWRPASNVKLHGSADLAVLRARQDDRTTPLPISSRVPVAGDVATHVGFAKGEFTAVESRLGASATVRVKASGNVSAGWVWVHDQLGTDGRISGLSGGPQLDARGAVQGVTISYGQGSGGLRMTTLPISDLQGFLPGHAGSSSGFRRASPAINVGQLHASGSITTVYCAATASPRNLPRS
jgi:serine protease Do